MSDFVFFRGGGGSAQTDIFPVYCELEAKAKAITTFSHGFSRAWHQLHIFSFELIILPRCLLTMFCFVFLYFNSFYSILFSYIFTNENNTSTEHTNNDKIQFKDCGYYPSRSPWDLVLFQLAINMHAKRLPQFE